MASIDGLNLFEYVRSNPLSLRDNTGTFALSPPEVSGTTGSVDESTTGDQNSAGYESTTGGSESEEVPEFEASDVYAEESSSDTPEEAQEAADETLNQFTGLAKIGGILIAFSVAPYATAGFILGYKLGTAQAQYDKGEITLEQLQSIQSEAFTDTALDLVTKGLSTSLQKLGPVGSRVKHLSGAMGKALSANNARARGETILGDEVTVHVRWMNKSGKVIKTRVTLDLTTKTSSGKTKLIESKFLEEGRDPIQARTSGQKKAYGAIEDPDFKVISITPVGKKAKEAGFETNKPLENWEFQQDVFYYPKPQKRG